MMQLRERKVLVRLKGGMGNQIFQYAFALHLTHGNPRNVICLLDYFRSDPRHGGFALRQLFGADLAVAEAPPADFGWVYLNADALADADLGFLHDSSIDLFIEGYFQHAWNFAPVIDTLRSMFWAQFDRGAYEKQLRRCLDTPTRQTVVAIHLRRGDYLNAEVRKVHGIPTPESMVTCLERIEAKDYCALIFSDARVEIELPCPAVRLSSGATRSLASDIDELRLMSCCNWIVASNSTFSYWAGMLSHQVQQLFLPDPWMRSGNVRTQSLLTARAVPYPTELL